MEPLIVGAIAVKVAVVALALYPIVRPGWGHFAGKAMGVRAVLYPAMMLLIPAIWPRRRADRRCLPATGARRTGLMPIHD